MRPKWVIFQRAQPGPPFILACTTTGSDVPPLPPNTRVIRSTSVFAEPPFSLPLDDTPNRCAARIRYIKMSTGIGAAPRKPQRDSIYAVNSRTFFFAAEKCAFVDYPGRVWDTCASHV